MRDDRRWRCAHADALIMVPSKNPKLDRDPARRAWKDADSWRRYTEHFYRTMDAIGPCALSPRYFAGASRHAPPLTPGPEKR